MPTTRKPSEDTVTIRSPSTDCKNASSIPAIIPIPNPAYHFHSVSHFADRSKSIPISTAACALYSLYSGKLAMIKEGIDQRSDHVGTFATQMISSAAKPAAALISVHIPAVL